MPNDRPGPEILTDEEVSAFLDENLFAALATVKRSGHPHLSTVIYKWDPAERIVRVSSTKDRLKVRQLRNDPHAALYVTSRDHTRYAVVEGTVELLETTEPGDAAGRELLAMGLGLPEAEQEEAFRKQVEEGRVVIRLRAERLYGMGLDLPPEMREL
ncbi:TIGR03618 family F420-dependent PPOX class oxidoreductase [Spirillospora sp. NPDC029432]|uniref:pyridoxamine 5'-phosphate oxidase family protein n=1 Tax=Spirillospora sp. NPDC029432 TaxID=3154599 RepID=UPI003456DE22